MEKLYTFAFRANMSNMFLDYFLIYSFYIQIKFIIPNFAEYFFNRQTVPSCKTPSQVERIMIIISSMCSIRIYQVTKCLHRQTGNGLVSDAVIIYVYSDFFVIQTRECKCHFLIRKIDSGHWKLTSTERRITTQFDSKLKF